MDLVFFVKIAQINGIMSGFALLTVGFFISPDYLLDKYYEM